MNTITVIKKNLAGQAVWRYKGTLRERGKFHVVLEARFDRADSDFHGMRLANGDLFVETFYSDRWYNIFEVFDREGDQQKGWYCNIGYPAEITKRTVSYVDLALDLLVFPDGRQLVLDEDEFAALPLKPATRSRALAALSELQDLFKPPEE